MPLLGRMFGLLKIDAVSYFPCKYKVNAHGSLWR
jgi:hypothetical protein